MNLPEPTYSFSTFHSVKDTQPERFEKTWKQVVDALSDSRVRQEKGGLLFSPVEFLPGTSRRNENVKQVGCLSLDFDTGVAPEVIRARFQEYEYLFYSTHSHTPEHPKFRLLLPLKEPVEGKDWLPLWRRVKEHLAPECDGARKDPAGMYYFPSHPPGTKPLFHANSGDLLNLWDLPEAKEKSSPPVRLEPGEVIGKGERNGRLYRLACSLRSKGLEQPAILAALEETNVSKCSPPLPSFEVRSLVASACTHAPGVASENKQAHRTPSVNDLPQQFRHTQADNAARFVARYRAEVAWVPEWKKWAVYQEGKWEKAQVESLIPRMRNVIKEYIDEGTKEATKWLKRTLAAPQLKQSFDHAQDDLARASSEFDAQPHLLNFTDGTLDLRLDGEGFREHRSSDLLTQKLEVPFEGERLKLWEETVESILPDPETRRYFQKSMGYLLSGEPDEDLVFLIHGPTRGGKGTLLGAVEYALGDYGEKLSLNALLQSRYDDARSASPHIAKLRGKRAAFVSEIKPNARFDAETIKTFSGRDTVTARLLHQNEETWVPQFSLVLVGNNRPKLPEDDDAVWARLREIPFKVSFAGDPNPEIRKALHNVEKSGTTILRWMYQGLQMYREEGLNPPPEVTEASKANRLEMNPLGDWLSEALPIHPERNHYEEWCKKEGAKPVGRNRFCKALEQLGYERRGQRWIKP